MVKYDVINAYSLHKIGDVYFIFKPQYKNDFSSSNLNYKKFLNLFNKKVKMGGELKDLSLSNL